MLSSWGDPWGILVGAIGLCMMVLFTGAIIGLFLLLGLARATRWCARELAGAATIDELLRLDVDSARIRSGLVARSLTRPRRLDRIAEAPAA